MAKSPSLDKLQSLTNEASAVRTVNENYERIESAFENTLSRDGSTPNQMEADLDLNGHRILNLPYPETDTEPFRKGDAVPLLDEVEELVNEAQDAAQLAGEYKNDASVSAAQARASAVEAKNSEDAATLAAQSLQETLDTLNKSIVDFELYDLGLITDPVIIEHIDLGEIGG